VRIAPEQDWEKVYPLRRVTTLEKVYGALDGMTAEDAEEEGVAEILLGIQVTHITFPRRHPSVYTMAAQTRSH
jgi:hypothetical protein